MTYILLAAPSNSQTTHTPSPPPEDEKEYGDDDQCPEGILEVDFSGTSPEQSEPILLAARQAGLRVRQPFKRAPGGGNRFQPRPKAKFQPRVPTPPRTGEREAKCGNCGGKHSTRDCPKPMLDDAKRKCFNCGEAGHQAKPSLASTLVGASNSKAARPCL